MSYLVDTNVLLRRARLGDPQHPAASGAINALVKQGGVLQITAQNVIEFWNVLTRPVDKNGFGLVASTSRSRDSAIGEVLSIVAGDTRHLRTLATIGGFCRRFWRAGA